MPVGLGDDDQCIEDDFTAWYTVKSLPSACVMRFYVVLPWLNARKIFHCKWQSLYRRELVWPELDQLLRDEDDTTVSTPYTAAILEYRVVYHDSADAPTFNKSLSTTNGHAVVDAQHPCRCMLIDFLDILPAYFRELVSIILESYQISPA